MHIFWTRLACFGHLGLISDPLIVSKFHNETHDPKGQANKIYTKVKGRETFYCRHTVNSDHIALLSGSNFCFARDKSQLMLGDILDWNVFVNFNMFKRFTSLFPS